RSFARRMVAQAAAAGLDVRMGFEVEWAVGSDEGEQFRPACRGPAYGMTRIVELSDYCHDLLGALAAESVEVLQLHPEYAAGQFEVSAAPLDPVAAADQVLLVRETIRAVSREYGMAASFAPAVEAGFVGNGQHLHLSLHRDGGNLLDGGPGPYGLTAAGQSFLAGVLEALPALCGIDAPSVASQIRLVPSHWAGVYRCWGRENREAALRLVTGSTGETGSAANVEVKCFDGSANPYLLVGAVLAVGLATLDKGLTLPAEVTGDPALADPAELQRLGVERLPDSPEATLASLEDSALLQEAMGDWLWDAFTAVRRAEIALFADHTPEQVVAATRWRY
ncbi:MAG: glutamine synthetase, partial [Nocardioidaceae bacterium]